MTSRETSRGLRPTRLLSEFMASEASGGLVLMAAAALALALANSPLASTYFDVLAAKVAGMSVLHWINDGLMAVFFLLVGMEIKREAVSGQLATWSQRILPGAAALGGMITPALVYLSFNSAPDGAPRGWAIPTATDIAFALGVLSLLGSRVPLSLKVFLTALAVIDDLGAVVIIALFYTSDIQLPALLAAGVVTSLLVVMNRLGVNRLLPYLLLGALLWFLVLQSGVHATVAGVLLALTIPLHVDANTRNAYGPLLVLEHRLHAWVAFLIVPVFGFANAGVSFANVSLSNLADPLPWGVAMGLFLGKQLGVFSFAWLTIKMRWAAMPEGARWSQVYGVALLCGIGFTMSLFIGLLSFPNSALLQDETKLGVLLGSLLSAVVGSVLLISVATRRSDH